MKTSRARYRNNEIKIRNVNNWLTSPNPKGLKKKRLGVTEAGSRIAKEKIITREINAVFLFISLALSYPS